MCETEIDTQPDLTRLARNKRRLLLAILITAAVWGVLSALLETGQGNSRLPDVFFGVAEIVLMVSWCHYDAQERGRSLSTGMRVALLLVWLVAFPVYAFKTRGAGGFKLLGLAGLFWCAMAVVFVAFSIVGDVIASLLVGRG